MLDSLETPVILLHLVVPCLFELQMPGLESEVCEETNKTCKLSMHGSVRGFNEMPNELYYPVHCLVLSVNQYAF